MRDLLEQGSRSRWMGPDLHPPARRIVSLVPSLTDAVFIIGAGGRLVARTDFCVRPVGQVEAVESVRGTKNPRLQRILELAPDVILANKEENVRRRIEALSSALPVWLTDPQSPGEVPSLWRELGQITGLSEQGGVLADRAAAALDNAARTRREVAGEGPSFLYYIWKDPVMAAGHGTYISNLLESVGFRNALATDRLRFPKISPGEIADASPDVHFFSSEPFLFELPRDLDLIGNPQAFESRRGVFWGPDAMRAVRVDAERLSWYPSLTIEGLEYAGALLRKLESL